MMDQRSLVTTGRMPVTRRQLLGLAFTAAGGLLLAACGGSTTATAVTQPPATTVPVTTAPTVAGTSATAPALAATVGPAAPAATATMTAPGGGGAAPTATTPPATLPTATPATAPTAPTVAATAAAQRVNANTAIQAELIAAFRAVGIASPDRWAREVAEYRPYPTNDPTFAKLRGELAKYNPGPGVVDQIIATLSL